MIMDRQEIEFLYYYRTACSAFWRFIFYDRIQELFSIIRGHNDALPPAAKTLFEKRVPDSQKLFIIGSAA